MTGLTFVDPSESTAETFSALLYGPPKIGKTVGACSAAGLGPVLVINADGPKALRYARRRYGNDAIHEVAFTGEQTFVDVYRHLRSGSAAERTVVVDHVGEVYRILLEEAVGGPGRAIPIQAYSDCQRKIERYVRVFRDLPVNSVWIMHEEVVETGHDAQTGAPVVETKPSGAGKVSAALPRHFDIVGYVSAIPAEGGEEGELVRVAQLVPGRGRAAGERYGVLGRVRPLDLAEWSQTIATEFYGNDPKERA